MGTNSALITKKVVENTFEILAIKFMSLLQIVDYMECSDKLSTITKKLYNELRAFVPKIVEDEPLYHHIEKIKQYLLKNRPNRIN